MTLWTARFARKVVSLLTDQLLSVNICPNVPEAVLHRASFNKFKMTGNGCLKIKLKGRNRLKLILWEAPMLTELLWSTRFNVSQNV